MFSMSRGTLAWLAASASLLALVVFAFSVGRYPLTVGDLVAAFGVRLFGLDAALPANAEAVIFEIRGPRVVAALAIGGALAAAGAAYQGMFRNPLVSPDILGVSGGAALGAVLGIFLSRDAWVIQAMAFAGGLAAVGLVFAIGGALRGHDPIVSLVLTGVVLGTLLGSLIAMLKYLADPYNQLPAITFWLLGSLAAVAPQDLWALLSLIAIGLAPLFALRWRMNLLALPEDEARALGVNTRLLRAIVILGATLATAASVAVSGVIGWIGLLIPHAARLLVGPDFGRLLPLSILLGAGFLLGIDTICRTATTIELPPGVLTALLGTPAFLWLLVIARRSW